jgi:hypothetical protein
LLATRGGEPSGFIRRSATPTPAIVGAVAVRVERSAPMPLSLNEKIDAIAEEEQ